MGGMCHAAVGVARQRRMEAKRNRNLELHQSSIGIGFASALAYIHDWRSLAAQDEVQGIAVLIVLFLPIRQ